MTFRPRNFRLNPYHRLSKGLQLALLGLHPNGDTAYDSSVYSRDGDLTNMSAADWDIGVDRYALDVVGGSKFVRASSASPGASDFSVSMRFKSSDLTGSGGIFDGGGGGGSAEYYWLICLSGALTWFHDNGSARVSASTSALPFDDGEWHHVLGVRAGTKIYLYVDGDLADETNTSGTATTAEPWDFGYTDYAYGASTCVLSDIAIWFRDVRSHARTLAGLDPTYGGWIQPANRLWFPVSTGAAPSVSTWLWARQLQSPVIGGGL